MAYITGSAGYDVITGSSGDDTIIGNAGNDDIKGYGGNDYYIFNRGDGQDTVIDSAGNDTISFGSGISLSDLQFFRSANNFIIRVKDTIDKIDIKNWFTGSKIENIVFSDGSSITAGYAESNVDNSTKVVIATSANDTVYGGSGSSLIYAMQGNDVIKTSEGNNIIEPSSGNDFIYNYGAGSDTIYCSTGNDYIEDYGGNDRYIFQKGDGNDTITDIMGLDTIKFSSGITQDNLVFLQSGNSRVIAFNNSTDTITIKDWYLNSQNRVEQLEFFDGTIGEDPDLECSEGEPFVDIITPTVIGTDGYNNLTGYNGNDVYYVMKGNDKIVDNSGNDTYLFNAGDGLDTIQDSIGIDTIKFGSGIAVSDLIFSQSSTNLIISIGTSDRITCLNWFYQDKYKIENLKFDDGAYLTIQDISNIIAGTPSRIEGTENNDFLNASAINDVVNGNAGNDTIKGNTGNDTISGGAGNDKIIDSSGSELYIFSSGDGQDIIQDTNGNDIIQFGSGISKDSLIFLKNDNDLLVKLQDSSDSINIQGWYIDVLNKIEEFHFADNSILTANEAENLIINYTPSPTVLGTDGYDYLKNYNGNDIYYAKGGNDRIIDYSGSDTYLFNRGDGRDSITDSSGIDTILFGSGITQDDVVFARSSGILNISIKNTADNISIIDWFTSNKYQIEKIQFNDGTYLTSSDVSSIIQSMASTTVPSGPQITGTDSSVQTLPMLVPIS